MGNSRLLPPGERQDIPMESSHDLATVGRRDSLGYRSLFSRRLVSEQGRQYRTKYRVRFACNILVSVSQGPQNADRLSSAGPHLGALSGVAVQGLLADETHEDTPGPGDAFRTALCVAVCGVARLRAGGDGSPVCICSRVWDRVSD